MESGTFYVQRRNINYTSGAQVHIGTSSHSKANRNSRKCKRSGCLVWLTMSLGLICVVLLVFIIWLNISLTAERDLLKRCKTNYTDVNSEKDQLKKSLIFLNQTNQKSEARVKALEAEKQELQRTNLELERNVTFLSNQLKMKDSDQVCLFFMSKNVKSWSESRQFCRDRGADLVMIKTEDKQRFLFPFVKQKVWIGLNDIQQEGNMTWVDNSTLTKGFWLNGEPNDQGGREDCIEVMPEHPVLNSWNDLPCTEKRIGMCEK